jgi:hypothetical protein
MELSKKSSLILLIIICFVIKANAQVKVFGKNKLEKIQNGHTHVVVSKLDFPGSDEFLDIFQKYWTQTKGIDFIEADHIQENLIPGDSYFSIETLTYDQTTNVMLAGRSMGAISMGIGLAIPTGKIGSIYLNLWIPTERSFKDQNFDIEHIYSLAHILLSADQETVKQDFHNDFNGDGHIYHWNPGLLKNYLQILIRQLNSDKPDHLSNHQRLGELKIKTLYCPDDNLNKAKGGTKEDIKEVFKNYKYDYQVISDEDLGKNILNEKDPFYYLLFIRDIGGKTIAVVNSENGGIVYSVFVQGSNLTKLKALDVEELYDKIKSN